MLGTVLEGRYELERLIAEGGMGAVYRARDRRLDRLVAVKLLGVRGDPLIRTRFAREARALARLSHPNVNAIFDAGEQDDRPYLVLELIEGYLLSQFQRGPYAVLVDLTLQALRALAYAHGQGVIHRDLKPANMLVVQDAGGSAGSWLLKVLDFGVAALTRGGRVAEQAEVAGTPAYLAPEQASGESIDGRADLYSLGVVLYELITGRPPFVNDNPVTVMFHHVNVAPEPPSLLRDGLPAPLERFVLRLLAKEPSQRHASAEEALADLEHVARDPGVAQSRPEALAFVPRVAMGASTAGTPSGGRRAISPQQEPTFHGRESELASLHEMLRETSDGRPRVAVVLGREGAGTTRLLGEFGRAAAEAGAVVSAVTCAPEGRTVPFAGLAAMLRAHAHATSIAEMRFLLGALSDAVEPLLRGEGGSRDEAPPPADADRIAEAVSLLVGAVAPARPMVLVFDDAHELDPETLRVLRFLAGRAAVPASGDDRACALVVAFGHRDACFAADTELGDFVAAMERLGCARRVALGALDEAHLQAVAMSLAAPGTDVAWGAAVAGLSAGTPGRVVGALALLEEAGLVLRTDLGWRPAAGAAPPAGLDELVRARLAPLSDGCMATLSHAAVLAHPIDDSVVVRMRAADQVPEAEIRRHLADAVAAGVLSASLTTDGSASRYGFVNPLVREAIYHGMNSMRRRRLHRRAADILSGGGLQPAVSSALLPHLQTLGDTSAIAACAATAARHALDAGDPREAERLYRLAVDSVAGEGGRERTSSLLLDLAAVQRGLGRYRSARSSLSRLVDLAEQRSAWGAAAVARTESAETAACAGEPEAVESEARLALASSMQAGQPALIKRSLSCLAMRQSLGGDWSEAMRTLRLADRTELGAGIRDRQASPIAHYAASLAMHQANRLLDDLEHGLAAWRGALMEEGCRGLAAQALLEVARALIALGDAPLALSRLVRGTADLPADAGPHAPVVIWLGMAEARAALGHWEPAERAAGAALAAATDPDVRAAAASVLVDCLTRRGSLGAAERLLERSELWAAELGPDWHGAASAHLRVAEGWARLGKSGAATAALDRADRYAAATGHARARLLSKLARAELEASRGDLAAARDAAMDARDEALRQADPLVAIRARAAAARIGVRLGLADADEHPAAGFAIAAAEAGHLGDERLAREIEEERETLLGAPPRAGQAQARDVAGVVRSLKEGLVATHDRDWTRAQRALEQAMRMGTSVGGFLAAASRVYAAKLLMAASSPRLAEAERLLYEARRLFGSERWHDDVDEVDVLLLKLGRRGTGAALVEAAGVS